MDALIRKFDRMQFLPAIWFILSRKDCDLNAIKAGQVRDVGSKAGARFMDHLCLYRPILPQSDPSSLWPDWGSYGS